MGDSNEIAAWGRRLRELVEARDGSLSTGFLGVAHLLHALESTGSLDTAYRLLLNDRYPSWLYSIRQGATTIWERWDGWTEEGGFQDVGMNSFNHYAFGSVCEWMFETIGGIRIEGYPCQIALAPEPGGDLTWAKVRWESPFGSVVSSWEQSKNAFEWNVSIPPGAKPRVAAPQSMREWTWSIGERAFDLNTSVTLGSGDYRFRAQR